MFRENQVGRLSAFNWDGDAVLDEKTLKSLKWKRIAGSRKWTLWDFIGSKNKDVPLDRMVRVGIFISPEKDVIGRNGTTKVRASPDKTLVQFFGWTQKSAATLFCVVANHILRKFGVDIRLRSPFYDQAMIRESMRLANMLKLSVEESAAVCDAFDISMDEPPDALLRSLIEKETLELVVMTRGADGALLVTRDEVIEQPGIPTRVVDTVGAGLLGRCICLRKCGSFRIVTVYGTPPDSILMDSAVVRQKGRP